MKTKMLQTRMIALIALVLIVGSIIPFSIQSAQAVQPISDSNSRQQESVDCSAVAFSSSNVNQLRGPDASFEIYRILYSGHHIEIVGKFISPVDEALWWLISDGSWIPAGAVDTSGNCEPVVELVFEDLFGLGINFETGLVDDCIVVSNGDTDQQSSPTGNNPSIQTTSLFNFTINAQLIITLDELHWWLLSSGLWVPAGNVDVEGPCDTVPLIKDDDLEVLGRGDSGEVEVCMILFTEDVPVFDNPLGGSTVFASFDTTLSNEYGAFEGVGQFEDDEGQLWWLLENGQWVNNADVIVHGPCGDLPAVSPDTDDTCIIRSAERGVRVRVGPGTNRGIFTALPVDEDFVVTGKFMAPDGTVWWRIDKADLDPDNTADSLWVAESAVTTAGNCDNVEEVDSSPFVVNSNPTGGGDSPGGGWGACGSCNSCGYSETECVTSPDGQCLWDPTTCRGIPQGDPNCLGFDVVITGGEPGTVSVSPPRNCTTTFGTQGYLPGTIISAVANDSDVSYWSGCAENEGNDVTFTMIVSCALIANFY